jgi:AcrR family transcriptional regulator
MRKGEATREAVLDTAGLLAAEVGLSGLTIGSLAERTEMSKSGLFAHFGSKESLQLQVLEHETERITQTVIRPALRAPRGEPRLRDLARRWFDWAAARGGCPMLAATFEFDDQPGTVRERVVASQRDWFDTITMVCSGGVTEGHFRADVEPREVAFDVQGVFVAFHIHTRLLATPDVRELADRSLDALITAAH